MSSYVVLELLDPPVDGRDHVRGEPSAGVVLTEFGDYECPNCATAERFVRRLLERNAGQLALVFRHLPVPELHPRARRAALAAEAAGEQGRYFEMHDILFENQLQLEDRHLLEYAGRLGLDVSQFAHDLESGRFEPRVSECLESARRSGANRTPSFFVDGRRHWELGFEALGRAVDAAIAERQEGEGTR